MATVVFDSAHTSAHPSLLPLPARRSCRLLGCVRARVCVEERVRRRGVVGGGGGGGRELAICQVTAERLE